MEAVARVPIPSDMGRAMAAMATVESIDLFLYKILVSAHGAQKTGVVRTGAVIKTRAVGLQTTPMPRAMTVGSFRKSQ